MSSVLSTRSSAGELHAPPAVTQGNGDGALGVVLANDVAVEFVDDLGVMDIVLMVLGLDKSAWEKPGPPGLSARNS
jgi:hypothetical protein